MEKTAYTAPSLEVTELDGADVLTESILMPPHHFNPNSEETDKI